MTETARDHETRGAVRMAMVTAFAVIAAFTGGKAARDAILLSNFDVEMLPWFVGSSAILSLPLVMYTGRLMARIGPARMMPALNAASAALLVGEWLLLQAEPRIAAVLCFHHLGSLGAILVSGFWSIINERFDVRSAKRHIGRIGLGATLGGIFGGVVAERSAVYLEPGAILLVLAGLQLLCAAIMRLLGGDRGRVHDVDAVAAREAWSAVGVIRRSRLLRALALVIVLGAIGAAALDYVFKAELTRAAGSEGPLRFFAIYHTATSILTAVVQLASSRAIVTRFGVARSIGILPATLTAFGLGALLVPGVWPIVIGRAAEMVTRSSIYRAAYELIYAPLVEADKRATKVLLDVGAERMGDLIGSQIIAAVLFLVAVPQPWLLGCALVAGGGALAFAAVLPRSYTAALEQRLLTHVDEAGGEPTGPADSMMWSTMGRATLADAGDLTAMSLLDLRAAGPPLVSVRHPVVAPAHHAPPIDEPPPSLDKPVERDAVADRVALLRSGNAAHVRHALTGKLVPELAAHVVALIGWDAVAPFAARALRDIAPRCTGVLADALLDATQEFTIRRRLPAIMVSGDPDLTSWALWRAIGDARFEVRYRCGRALARLQDQHDTPPADLAVVFAIVRKELSVGMEVWRSHQLLDGNDDRGDLDGGGSDRDDAGVMRRILHRRSAIGLDHVFTLLGLSLPPEPIRIAFQGLFTEDRTLRATALEYLESVLPSDVRGLLWPFIDASPATLAAARPTEEIAAALVRSHPTIVKTLREIADRH